MEPTNNKHLFHVLMDAIDRTASGDMKPQVAREISELAARVNSLHKVEHDRTRVVIELERHKAKFPDTKATLRNIEGKNFE